MRRTTCLLALAAVSAGLAAPAAATGIAPVGVTGTVQEVVVEHPGVPGAGDDVRRVLVVGGRTVGLPAGALPGRHTGDRVQVRLGTAADGTALVLSSRLMGRARAVSATSTTSPVQHDVFVAIVSPKGWTLAENRATAASTGALVAQASDYWSSQTGDRVRFSVSRTLAPYVSAYSCSDPGSAYRMWNEALDRFDKATGQTDTAYGIDRHLLVVLPDGAAVEDECPYGYGTVGSLHTDGGAVMVSDSNQSLYAHELGHNLGLQHSNALHCSSADAKPTAVSGGTATWPSTCLAEPYGDLLDVMGYSGERYGEGNLNAVHVDRTGLTPTAVKAVTTNGTRTVRIAPLSAPVAQLRTLLVTDGSGGRYYAEYRTDSGRDGVARRNEQDPGLGLRVLREDPAQRNGSYVLDGTPTGRTYDYANALPTGATFTSANGAVVLKLSAADATGATLQVTRAARPASVQVTVPARAAAGAAATASAKVKDATGAGVGGWATTLQVRPAGSTTWRTVTTATTSSSGTASFAYVNGTTGTYRAVTATRTGVAARTSASAATTSYAAPALTAPPAEVSRGTVLRLSGSLKGTPSAVVQLQARLGTAPYADTVRATVSGSTLTAAFTPPSAGTWQLRWRVAADPSGRYAGGSSSARTVTIR